MRFTFLVLLMARVKIKIYSSSKVNLICAPFNMLCFLELCNPDNIHRPFPLIRTFNVCIFVMTGQC